MYRFGSWALLSASTITSFQNRFQMELFLLDKPGAFDELVLLGFVTGFAVLNHLILRDSNLAVINNDSDS